MLSLALAAACTTLAGFSRSSEPKVYVMDSSSSSIMGASSVTFDLKFIADGEALWTPGSSWANVPEWLSLASAGNGNGITLAQGSIANYFCPGVVKECELYVFQYHCAGCGTTKGGGLKEHLEGRGWKLFSCAPSFRMAEGGALYKMTGWRLVVDGNTWTQLVTEADADYVAVGVRAGLVYCDEYTTEASCDASSARCQWDRDTCVFRMCGKRQAWVGPDLPSGGTTPSLGLFPPVSALPSGIPAPVPTVGTGSGLVSQFSPSTSMCTRTCISP